MPEETRAVAVAGSATPTTGVPLAEETKDRRGLGRDEMSQAELERELEELWLTHVQPHFPQA